MTVRVSPSAERPAVRAKGTVRPSAKPRVKSARNRESVGRRRGGRLLRGLLMAAGMWSVRVISLREKEILDALEEDGNDASTGEASDKVLMSLLASMIGSVNELSRGRVYVSECEPRVS